VQNMFYQFIDREFLRGEAPQWSSEAGAEVNILWTQPDQVW